MSTRKSGKTVHLHAVVRGFVQGVGFRLKAKELADQLGLSGCVRNTSARALDVHAEGPRQKLEIMLGWLHIGPPVAYVTSVKASWSPARGPAKGFAIVGGRTTTR